MLTQLLDLRFVKVRGKYRGYALGTVLLHHDSMIIKACPPGGQSHSLKWIRESLDMTRWSTPRDKRILGERGRFLMR